MRKNRNSLFNIFFTLWSLLPKERKAGFITALILMLVASICEFISIGITLPFILLITNPDKIFQIDKLNPLFSFFNQGSLILLITILFITGIILAGLMRLVLLRFNLNFSFSVGKDLGLDMFRRTLYQSYLVHTSRNTSEIVDGIWRKTTTLINMVNSILILFSSLLIFFAIILAMAYIDWIITLWALIFFSGFYLIIIAFTNSIQMNNSKVVSIESVNLIKCIQEALGGIRDVLIDGSQEVYCLEFKRADAALRSSQVSNQFISQNPKYYMEAIVIITIAILAYILASRENGISGYLPILGSLALGGQRLLPLIQQSYQSWSSIKGDQASLEAAILLLQQPIPINVNAKGDEKICFNKNVILKGVSFRYDIDSDWVLKDIDLELQKGERIGVIGASGSGKTTLLDIIMGLLEPTAGEIKVDNQVLESHNLQAWRNCIGHVSQQVFLSDASILENIAFGVRRDLIDYQRVERAVAAAQLADTIDGLPHGYKTIIGERGARLSGGQRQRIAIARALYKNASILVFDEATNALDVDTEDSLMSAINSLGNSITVLVVTHRLMSLKNMTRIVEVSSDGVACRTGAHSFDGRITKRH